MSAAVSSLATLLKQTHIDDDEEVLRAANAALKQNKGDVDAQHVKVVALLKLDRFDEALRALEQGGAALQRKAQLEHAYALYKSGDPGAAARLAHGQTTRAFRHVEAQAAYRHEDFARAAELYRELATDPADDAEADLRVNGGAADAQLEWAGQGHAVQKKKPSREDLEAFETAYNAACGSIARGELGQAEVLLKRARDLCLALDDLSDEDKQAELLPIAVQQIYVLVRLGREKDAEALAEQLDVESVPGLSTRHIAQINKIAGAGASANPYLTQRFVSRDVSTLKSDLPFKFQVSALQQNRYAADLQALKFDGTAGSTQQTLSKTTLPTTDAFYTVSSVINAAAHARNQTGKEALRHILPVLERRPNDVGLVLTVTQLYVLAGNPAAAISLLERFLSRLESSSNTTEHEVRFAPGLVGILVSLYRSQGRKAPLRAELSKAATYWQKQKSASRPIGTVHLLKAAGTALLESQDAEHIQLARSIFAELHEQDPSDRYAAAGLLAASPGKAQQQSASLTSIDKLIAHVDATALESAGIANLPASAAATTAQKRPAAADPKTKSKPRKIRRTHMPKDFDPNKKPDPERWLPLRDRSSYRPKGKKGKARQALLSQGAAAPAGDSESSRPATPAAEVVKGKQGGGGGGGGGGAKKKKKGGKW